ncbi:MAG: hypothetical protein C0467_08075 [Planctomycetaceae bacterium]|nr:hypothetical protein [Planctomycetaceae bacterium]
MSPADPNADPLDGTRSTPLFPGEELAQNETLTQLTAATEPKPNSATFHPEVQALLAEMGFNADPNLDSTATRFPHELSRPPQGESRRPIPEIPGYQITGELGRGGMGVVYKAQHLRLNRTVAIKMMLRSGGAADLRAVSRFLIEAEAMASIKHPHVVQVYEFGEREKSPFLVLEYLPGGSLTDRLTNGTRMKPLEAAKLIGQVARAAAAIHSANIVHRDLKPGNILFDADGLPKIADFGLAKRAASELTETQAIMGTPAYMAPEQADGRTKFVGPPADVWSLGVILYECLVGTRPFAAPVASEILAKILASSPTPIRRVVRDLPPELELICQKCLEKNPAERYSTAEELADDLERFQAGKPISVRPLGVVHRGCRWVRRNPAVASLAAFACLTLLVVPPAAFLYRARLAAAEKLTEAQTRAEAEARRAESEARRAEVEARRAATEASHAVMTKEYFNLLGRVHRNSTEPHAGWTWEGLRDLSQAGGYTDLAAGDPVELRSAAAVCLASPDLREIATAGPGMSARALAFRPDGKVLAIAEAKSWISCRVLLVDPTTGKTLRTLTFKGIPVSSQGGGFAQDGGRAMCFSPDGRWLIVGCRSGQICRWDLAQERPTAFIWPGHQKEVSGVAFDPEGTYFYSSAFDGTVKRWAVDGKGKELAQVPPDGSGKAVGGLIVLPNQPRRVVFERNGLESASPETLSLLKDERIADMVGWRAATPSGNQLLSSGPTGLAVWDRLLRQCGRNLSDPELDQDAQRGYGRGAAVSPDSSLAATFAGSNDGTLRLWDLASGRLALRLALGETLAATISPNGQQLVVATDRKTVIYEVRHGSEHRTLTQATPIRAFGVRPDGRVVTIASSPQPEHDGTVGNLFLDWPTDGTPPRTLWNRRSRLVSQTFIAAPFAGGMACSDGNGWIDLESGGAIKTPGIQIDMQVGDDYIFQPDRNGQRLWLAHQKKLTVLNLPRREAVAEWRNDLADFTSGLAGLTCVDAVDRYAVVGARDGTVRLMRYLEDGKTRRIEVDATWTSDAGATTAVALSADETLVGSGMHKGRVVVRQISDGKVVADLDAHTDRVTSIAFSHDGRLLVTGSRDKRVRLWQRSPGGYQLLVNLSSIGASAVQQVAFAPDGHLLILRERESAIHCWDVEQLRIRFTKMGIGW